AAREVRVIGMAGGPRGFTAAFHDGDDPDAENGDRRFDVSAGGESRGPSSDPRFAKQRGASGARWRFRCADERDLDADVEGAADFLHAAIRGAARFVFQPFSASPGAVDDVFSATERAGAGAVWTFCGRTITAVAENQAFGRGFSRDAIMVLRQVGGT